MIRCTQCDREGEEFSPGAPPVGWIDMTYVARDGRHTTALGCSPQCAAFLSHSLSRGERDVHALGESETCRLCRSNRESAPHDTFDPAAFVAAILEGIRAQGVPSHDHPWKPAPVYGGSGAGSVDPTIGQPVHAKDIPFTRVIPGHTKHPTDVVRDVIAPPE